jgi:UDP-N-acetylglucosamine 2-epimerase (non-hydrolysing)
MRLAYVVGTRPNFVKMAPVVAELRRRFPSADHVVVHTGQHYDEMMSGVFLAELDFPEADYVLDVGSGTHAVQTARVMERLEPILLRVQPDLVLVPGDVNSTLATALVAAKLGIPIAHVESGLRSYDRSMPEEINRVMVDHTSEHLFIHSEDARENLQREGISDDRIFFVGNTMIDSLVAVEPEIRRRSASAAYGLPQGGYLLVTLHRPALVDGPLLPVVMERLAEVARELPVLFPVHPRTRKMIEASEPQSGIVLAEPVGYLDFLSLEADAAAVLTDSGGIQEETTYLGVRCFTLRDNTERPVTLTRGTNELLGLNPDRIPDVIGALAHPRPLPQSPPPLWDGLAATRVGAVLEACLAPASVAA